jgi:molybdenum-dependent DNA-binding transcriptional regulator ModE
VNPRGQAAGAALLRERIARYVEYAELIEAQAQAAEAGDLDQVAALGHRLDELEDTLATLPDPGGESRAEGPGETPGVEARLRTEAAAVLERASASQRRLAAALRAAHRETRNELRSLQGRGDQLRTYLGEAPSAGQVNVRF